MKNFIVFFSEKEGSSALMHMLDNFEEINIVHQINNQGWEPLDRHKTGSLSIKRLSLLLNGVYGYKKISSKKLNVIYEKTADLPLIELNRNKSIGFKMRLVPHKYIYRVAQTRFDFWNKFWHKRTQEKYPQKFVKTVYEALVKNKVVVFLTVRQDVLRWALSKYHGDGTGKPGHIQFRLATGQLQRDEIEKVTVDCNRLEMIIKGCEAQHAKYRELADKLKDMGLEVYPLKYEDFLENKRKYFNELGSYLDIDWSDSQIDMAVSAGTYLKKVHSNNIESFVVNHQEVMERFGDRYVAWL